MTKFFDHLSGEHVEMRTDIGRAMRLRAEALIAPVEAPQDPWSSARESDRVAQPEDTLPEGVSLRSGRYFADCCVCGRDCDVTEFADDHDIDFNRWYGGCGPRCCP